MVLDNELEKGAEVWSIYPKKFSAAAQKNTRTPLTAPAPIKKNEPTKLSPGQK
jgi:hypothetical protein